MWDQKNMQWLNWRVYKTILVNFCRAKELTRVLTLVHNQAVCPSFIFQCAKEHSHKTKKPGTTELVVGNMSTELYSRNILDQ